MIVPRSLPILAILFLTACAPIDVPISSDPATLQKFERNEQNRIVTVKGCVRQPGQIHLKPGETLTLTEVLLRTGGFSTFARDADLPNFRNIQVERRQGDSIRRIKVTAYPGHDADDFVIQPGDVVTIPTVPF